MWRTVIVHLRANRITCPITLPLSDIHHRVTCRMAKFQVDPALHVLPANQLHPYLVEFVWKLEWINLKKKKKKNTRHEVKV